MVDPYTFRRADVDDLPLLRRWIARDHVRRWWDDDDPFEAGDLFGDAFVPWIVKRADEPFAYMQDYDVHAFGEHHFAHLPKGSRGIDQFIGQLEMTGIGHGSRFIMQRIEVLFGSGVPAVATDPHPENARAIAAYRKAGFQIAGEPVKTRWGLILPMVAFAGARRAV